MPYTIPEGFGDVTKSGESSGGFTEIRGIFPASIYKVEPGSHSRNGGTVQVYNIDYRIDGGEYDGEDVKREYVGLYADAIFTLHDILVALGELDTYYKRNPDPKPGEPAGQWVALPEPADLEGKKLYIQVDNAQWQSSDRSSGVGLVHQQDDPAKGVKAGEPILRDGNGVSAHFSINEPMPEYRPRRIKPNLRKQQQTLGQVPQVPGGFPGQVGAGTATNDPWGAAPQGQAAQQPGTSAW